MLAEHATPAAITALGAVIVALIGAAGTITARWLDARHADRIRRLDERNTTQHLDNMLMLKSIADDVTTVRADVRETRADVRDVKAELGEVRSDVRHLKADGRVQDDRLDRLEHDNRPDHHNEGGATP